MPNNRTYPVSSYGPEIMAALLRGAQAEFVVGPIPYRDAVRFHFRLHSLRASMRKENHEHFAIVSRAKISIVWGKKAGLAEVPQKFNSRNVPRPEDPEAPSKLIICPHDSDFAPALLAAGIKAHELKSDPLADIPIVGAPVTGSDYLETILKEKKPPGV